MLDLVRRHLRFENQWRVRCRSCGHARDLAELGGVRTALPLSKPTLVWCTCCRGLRIAMVEPRSPLHEDDPVPRD